ncbi:MAG: family metallo-hydrolase [Segetibacter sp.]|nr:family metallo-hydrolase [Segetibacter sp.]
MKKIISASLLLTITIASYAQSIDKIVTPKEVERIETTLASDEMLGRKAFTPGIEKSADFISAEFKKIGLQPMQGLTSFRQTFEIIRPRFVSASGTINGEVKDNKSIIVFTASPSLTVNENSGYKKTTIAAGSNLNAEVSKYLKSNENILITVDTSFTKTFGNLAALKRALYNPLGNVIVVLSPTEPTTFSIKAEQEITKLTGSNIVGVLPGKSKKEEYVIFSGHYDHLGIGKPEGTDSIYNGANDDAAGITAVIMAAKYYKALGNNERTLVFVAFTGEESGLLGSQFFSRKLNAKQVVAMFNIEMIGTESKWGKASAYVTGYNMSDLGKIMQKNVKEGSFTFYDDPYTTMRLFFRSDNATLARLGVPAHTISTSKMDVEPFYHKAGDEVKTLDMDNMTTVIKAIITGATGIVSGKETPTRVALPTQ